MQIYVTKPAAPTVEPHIQEALDDMSPRVFLRWNKTYQKSGLVTPDQGIPIWEGRWEIWCELDNSRHPDARNEIARSDVWNSEAQCWMRKLQTYKTADGGFAPADERLIWGLQLADAWANRRFYEENIEEPFELQEAARRKAIREPASAASRYYFGLDNPIVGRYFNSGWRHRIR